MGEYRPNVAALMVNANGRLLICERLLNPGAWQFPQGGVDEGESPDDAILREVEEEIGFQSGDYVVEKSLGGYRYVYPPAVQLSKPPHKARFVGQEQRYYQCRVKEGAPEVDLMQEPREFARAKWILPEEFQLDWLPDFKKETYRAVLRDFFGVEI
ncbi:MAG: putative (di)nucleoside polyphosphate hydrolase [Akkermansiaceae bacterium]|jgi:putative (di)nucleoside polyphosphate hydrolase